MKRLTNTLFQSVDGASLAVVRILFGLVMFAWCISYLALGKIQNFYVEPTYHFKYVGFHWVQVASESAMTSIFLLMGASALLIALGWFYRIAAIGFAILFIYVFLVDKTTYQNHYYFVCLMSLLMASVPANRAWSVDNRLGRIATSSSVPMWSIWLIRFQVGVVYFFGGVAKISPDWIQGFPMRGMLAQQESHVLLAPFAHEEWAVQTIVWGGMLFDLLIVPLLLWKRTRILAFCLVVFFHITNSIMFPIGIFPWIMIGLTSIFLEPDWPRRLLRPEEESIPVSRSNTDTLSSWRTAIVTLLVAWCLVQVTLPFRHWLYPGNVNWTERGHYFSWHMMLRGKRSAIRFHILDPVTGRRGIYPLQNDLQTHQLARMSRDPELIRDFACHIEATCQSHGFRDVEVRAFVLCSLNGRRPQLLISPEVDLTSPELRSTEDWVIPLSEPLPQEIWEHPLTSWEQLVMTDPLNSYMPPRAEPSS
ncbi:Vitamin K-dependent gamma-carboxylase [Bremerella volcania]|uniref:Vitamin K-dependent gamma-carboxylase n=1 Tax=Bremerella volcania TaxID=2527984 RepID=A0A518C9H1_9BACT|nr:HTTM domain-containing protein [Bremerella volcania]QDU75869.1 Vitamin K-dependent gamma-carboxylase [Bremerella volcania]